VGQILSLCHFAVYVSLLVQTALISFLASAAFAWLFFLFSATCTGLIASAASAALARCLTTRDRKRSAYQETSDREPSQDLLNILEIHDSPPFGSLPNHLSAQDKKDPLF
jgi:hypothetical protein